MNFQDSSNPILFALVYMLECDGCQARLVASTGIDSGTGLSPRIIDLTSLAEANPWPIADVVRTRNSVLVGGPQADGALTQWHLPNVAPGVAFVAPMVHGDQGKVLGAVVLGMNPSLDYDEEYSQFLSLAADRLSGHATATRAYEQERKQSQEALQESNKRLNLLSDIAARLLLTDNPQGLVQSLCERILETLDCHAFFNYLVDEERGCLHLNACAGIPDEVAKTIEWLDYGAAVCGCVARDGCRVVAEDIFNTPDPRTDLVKGYGIQAYACHPLLAEGGRVIGTLSFGSKSRKSFSDDDLSLMKAVADQVATAMARIRMLDSERRRAEELQAVLDATPAIVWIAHDTESRSITGNRASYEILRLPTDANASKTAPEDQRPTHFKVLKDGEEIPLDKLPVQMAAKGAIIRDFEFDVVFDDGTVCHLLGDAVPLFDDSGQPRGSVGAFVDITDRKNAQQRELEIEAHKRDFYRRTILAATEGKLMISEPEEIAALAGPAIASWQIASLADVGTARDGVAEMAREAGMAEQSVRAFMGCVVESASNALKHAHRGRASLHQTPDGLMFVISDGGAGIGAMALPDVALTRGYSTAGTLGMGYKLMIHFADRVYLATGPDGTIVAMQMGFRAGAEPHLSDNRRALSGWID